MTTGYPESLGGTLLEWPAVIPPFHELVRAANGPYVTVEIDDVFTAGPVLGLLAVLATRLHLMEGPCRVRVGIDRGNSLEVIDHGYRNVQTATSVATALVEQIKKEGLEAVSEWDENPSDLASA